jgi:asparagine synthase (glutamine-hydrolysing)
VETGVLERVMSRLAHRGPDGRDEFFKASLAMGHWHFWTTPEEVNERQPLTVAGLPFWIVFDGRLDDRPHLLTLLGLTSSDDVLLSDAALVLYAYARWGVDCLPRFLGEFAFILFDESRNELFCARDPLGDRTLFYSLTDTRFVAASEAWAAAGAMDRVELNETAAAHFFALRAPEDGQTFFRNIHELLPAHGMIVHAGGMRQWRYWAPDPSLRARGRSDEELAGEFRSLLEQSVRSRLRATTPVGILMSGGLDSGSLACLASQMLAPEPLTTISYVFDELKDCDEREYIQTIIDRYGVRSIQIPCDDAWSWKDWETWPRPPNQPEANPYRLLKERAYRRAHEEGLRVLMPGAFGDNLYCGEEDWLADLFVDGRLREAGQEFYRHIRHAGWRKTLKSDYLRQAGRRMLNSIPGIKRRHRRSIPAWLTPHSLALLSDDHAWFESAFELRGNLLGNNVAQDSAYEIFNASRHELELRHPYRDRRLVEFMLTLPAYQLYNRGYYKYILRRAMRDCLPQPILARLQSTPLFSLISRGREREGSLLQASITAPDAAWRKYVRPDWLIERSQIELTQETDGPEAIIPWLCVSFSAWFQASFSSA